jgi:hypothetical protein
MVWKILPPVLKFMSYNSFDEIIIKWNSTQFSLHVFKWLACMLFIPIAHISFACDQIALGKHVLLNGWLMRYGTMRWTFLSVAKCLGCFIWKNSLASSSLMIYSHQSRMLFTLENLIHMLLVITLSFVKLLRPLLEAFHAFMTKITYTRSARMCGVSRLAGWSRLAVCCWFTPEPPFFFLFLHRFLHCSSDSSSVL